MKNPALISLTGIDENTNLDDLGELSTMGPKVEFGVLYMPGSDIGRGPRYPGVKAREKFLDYRVNGQPLKLAAHLCGREVFDAILDPKRRKDILVDIERYDRVQLNVNARTKYFDDMSVDMLFTILNHFGFTTILQMHDRSREILNKYFKSQEIHGEYKNVHVLFDQSGGLGRVPGDWEKAVPYNSTSFFGYAGGLGPGTLPSQIDAISAAAGNHPYWIDMESGIRTDDWFDAKKAKRVVEMFA